MALLLVLLSACGTPTPQATPEIEPSAPAAATETPVADAALPPQETPVSVVVSDESSGAGAQPTLVAPTQMPAIPTVQPTLPPTLSALERIRSDSRLRVGVLYNAAPLSSLDERGQVIGYEADLARAIAADWQVELEFVQVTRQTAIPSLLAGEVDILMASVIHRRESEEGVAFSQTYFVSGQMFLVRTDSDVQSVAQLEGRRIGVVQGTESERALGRATYSGRLGVTPVFYLTLDQAIGGLGSGEVDAVLGTRIQLAPVAQRADNVRLVDEMLEAEPFGIVYLRHDDALGYLLDRSLQRIYAEDGFSGIRRTWFPNMQFSLEVPVWAGLDDDTRGLADFDTAIVYPETSVIDRIAAGEPLRVAGLSQSQELSGLNLRLESFYRAVVDEMAGRWGATVTYIPDSGANAIDLVAAGQADLAVGITPNWTGPYAVAYGPPLVSHGKRLMLPAGSDVAGFADLRGGKWIGIFASEPGSADVVNELAASVNTRVNIFTIINDEDAVYSMLVDGNADAVFGDNLRLQPLLEANADLVRLTDRQYTTEYFGMGIARTDIDWRELVAITLQEMGTDGSFARIWAEQIGFGEPVMFEQWPGMGSDYHGIGIARPAQ